MPAKFVKSYQSPDGQVFSTLDQAQEHELVQFIRHQFPDEKGEDSDAPRTPGDMARMLVAQRPDILSILKQRERKNLSPAKPRKVRKASQPVAA